MVGTVIRSSMCNVSQLSNTIWYVCFKKDIDLHGLHALSKGEMNNTIIGKWSDSVNDDDKRVGMQVLELYIESDSLNEWVFDRGESLILFLLCVI